MLEISLFGALAAGLFSFFTPCVLPMVPFYLSYMGGMSIAELQGGGGTAAAGAQRRLALAAVAFAAGVTSVFMLLGLGATALGQLFSDYFDVLTYAAAAVLLVFGLHFLGVVKVGLLYRQARFEGGGGEGGSVLGGYVMGLAFGFGWTPCVGPALAAILMLASGMGEVWRGGLLLFVYGAGMTAPFIAAALFAGPFLRWSQRHRAVLVRAEKVMGAMLVLFAVLLASGGVQLIGQQMLEWMPAAANWG